MKWLKRLLMLVVFVGVLAGVVAASGWWMSRRAPEWYSRRHPSAQESAEAAHRAEQQVQRTLSWAADQQAATDSSRYGEPSTRPAKTLTISFTEDELNGFFEKWDATFGWSRGYGPYLSDPQIVLPDGKLILAATAKQMGTVISIVFSPRVEDGKLDMPPERVLAGTLPLPQSFWDRYRTELVNRLDECLSPWQSGAEIRPNGTANSDAVAAAMGELVVNILNERPADAVLFLPYDVSHRQRSLPVKLTKVQIANRTLTLRVEPLTRSERSELLANIRAPRTERTASAASPLINGVISQ